MFKQIINVIFVELKIVVVYGVLFYFIVFGFLFFIFLFSVNYIYDFKFEVYDLDNQ